MKVLALALVLTLAASPAYCQSEAGGALAPSTSPPGSPPPATTPPPPATTPPPPFVPPSPAPPTNNTPPPAPAPPVVPPPVVAPPPVQPPTVPPPKPAPKVAPAAQPSKAPAPAPKAAVSPPPGTPPASPPPPGTTGGGGVSTGGSSSTNSGSGSGSGPSEADVLTFAYNLECLEGNFYSCAAFGTPLNSTITGGGPAPSSCTKANLTNNTAAYAQELAREETAHVAFLYSALKANGGNPVCPQVNIDTAFEAAAQAAFNSTSPLNPIFDPYANDYFFLHGSFIFEDLGASAYAGGVGLLSTPAFRQAATQIGNTESYHSGIIRTLLYSVINETPAYNNTVAQITSAIVSALNSLSGSPQLKYTLINEQGVSLSNVDSTALVPVATPAQVLKVVTLNAPAGSGGGFFPDNLNGNVKN